jgi:hypothetical protein
MGPAGNLQGFTNFTNLLTSRGSYKQDPIDDGHSLNHAHHETDPLIQKAARHVSWRKKFTRCFDQQNNT